MFPYNHNESPEASDVSSVKPDNLANSMRRLLVGLAHLRETNVRGKQATDGIGLSAYHSTPAAGSGPVKPYAHTEELEKQLNSGAPMLPLLAQIVEQVAQSVDEARGFATMLEANAER